MVVRPGPAQPRRQPVDRVLHDVYTFCLVAEHMSLQDAGRLGRTCRRLAQCWRYVCRYRLLPAVLHWHAGRPWTALPATLPVRLPDGCAWHGPRVQRAVALLLADLPAAGGAMNAADAKYASFGCLPSVARVLACWLAVRRGGGGGPDGQQQQCWPHVPAAFFGSSLAAAERAADEAGAVQLAAATVTYAVMSVPFLLRAGDPVRRRLTPPLVPAEADGADQARAFVVQNGMFFASGAIDALAHRAAYEHDAQTGGIAGTAGQREAWLCAARYMQRSSVVLPPPDRPSVRPGMSGGIGRDAWQQTVLPPAYTPRLVTWWRELVAQKQPLQPGSDGGGGGGGGLDVYLAHVPPLRVRQMTGGTLLLVLPNAGCVCTFRRRWLDQLWVVRWMRRALDLTNGAVPLRCRILQAMVQGQ